MIITRQWAMPSPDTFSIKPIGQLVKKYLAQSEVSVDPFARNCRWATYTNDLNRDTEAEYHLTAHEFLYTLAYKNVRIDLAFFDPPYSLRQIKECYDKYGHGFTHKDSQNAVRWTWERDTLNSIMKPGGIVISFGWSTTCMGKKRGYEITEILMVSHGPAHNDTLCTVERKK